MLTHIVRQGETIPGIAKHRGFTDWRLVYDDPANALLRASRPNPNVLFPGDEVQIPERRTKQVPVNTEKHHRFRVGGAAQWLRVVLKDINDHAVSGAEYRIEVEGGRWHGTTGAAGLIAQKIPIGAQQGTLFVREAGAPVEDVIPLKIGHLDPEDKSSGWQARLNNLGYNAGPTGSTDDERIRSAVEEFQCDFGLQVTGVCNAATQARLKDAHGC